MSRPSRPSSTAPTWPNTCSRVPATVKAVDEAAGAAAAARVALAVGGKAIAPEVSGRFRSGGTSSGRASALSA